MRKAVFFVLVLFSLFSVSVQARDLSDLANFAFSQKDYYSIGERYAVARAAFDACSEVTYLLPGPSQPEIVSVFENAGEFSAKDRMTISSYRLSSAIRACVHLGGKLRSNQTLKDEGLFWAELADAFAVIDINDYENSAQWAGAISQPSHASISALSDQFVKLFIRMNISVLRDL